LDDRLVIREDLTTADTDIPISFDIQDLFDTENQFHGGEIGLLWEGQRWRWSLEVLGKIALGNSRQTVQISGSTVTSPGPSVEPGGLLALPTNIGTYTQDKFAVVPEFGATLGYQMTSCLRLMFGYTGIYWNHVARAGDQIDLGVNPTFLPSEDPVGPERPAFAFVDADYWAQGITFGADFHW
jgi:hypothetical protein